MSTTAIINTHTEQVDPATLTPHPRNPRRGDLDAIRASIRAHGFYGAVVAQSSTRRVLAGNHRLLAAREEGLSKIPVAWVDVDNETALRILAADNRTSDLGGYDDAFLASLLSELAETDIGLEGLGYDEGDLTELLGGLMGEVEQGPPPPPPDVSDALREKWDTERGQIWKVGDHRLMCGDCRAPDDVALLMDGQRVNVAFTSPPYASQRTYDESSGFRPIKPEDYVEWFEPVQSNVRAHLADDGSWFVNIKAHCEDGQRVLYVMDLVLAHVRRWGWRFVDDFAWLRVGVPGHPLKMGRRFKSGHEPVFHLALIPEFKMNPDAVRTPSSSTFSYDPDIASGPLLKADGRAHTLTHPITDGLAFPSTALSLYGGVPSTHPAAFPVALPTFFIKAYSDPGDIIFDPFHGSGTTAVAAEQTGRICYGMEISPAYLAAQLERLSEMGLTPEKVSG